jgi:hypothetical protein
MTIVTEEDHPQQEPKNKYQLYREDVDPCRWYLAVNGHEAQQILSGELNIQHRFRNWHSDHGLRPPDSTERHNFEKFIGRLYDNAVPYTKTLPFLQTNAGIIENLVFYFDIHIISDHRRKGSEFMEGDYGDFVRVVQGINRVHFKWQMMKKFWMRALNANSAEIDVLKKFITNKGGYQPEAGARDWFRWTYWLPLDLFNDETKERWFKEESSQD